MSDKKTIRERIEVAIKDAWFECLIDHHMDVDAAVTAILAIVNDEADARQIYDSHLNTLIIERARVKEALEGLQLLDTDYGDVLKREEVFEAIEDK